MAWLRLLAVERPLNTRFEHGAAGRILTCGTPHGQYFERVSCTSPCAERCAWGLAPWVIQLGGSRSTPCEVCGAEVLHVRLHLGHQLLNVVLWVGGSLYQLVLLRRFIVNKKSCSIVFFWFEKKLLICICKVLVPFLLDRHSWTCQVACLQRREG